MAQQRKLKKIFKDTQNYIQQCKDLLLSQWQYVWTVSQSNRRIEAAEMHFVTAEALKEDLQIEFKTTINCAIC